MCRTWVWLRTESNESLESTMCCFQILDLSFHAYALVLKPVDEERIEVLAIDSREQAHKETATESCGEELLDELHSRHGGLREDSLSGTAALWVQEALFLVVPQRTGTHASPGR